MASIGIKHWRRFLRRFRRHQELFISLQLRHIHPNRAFSRIQFHSSKRFCPCYHDECQWKVHKSPIFQNKCSSASQICHDVRYGQMRAALDELRDMDTWSPRRCSTLIFTDTSVVKQSNELFCRGVEEANASDCLLDSVFESRGCPLANVHLFGNCNSGIGHYFCGSYAFIILDNDRN